MPVKKITNKISVKAQNIIFVLLSGFYVFSNIYVQETIFDIFLKLVITALVLIAVWKLVLTHFHFAGYFVLLLIGYFDGAYDFIKFIISYNSSSGFDSSFSWLNLIFFIGSIYLIILAIHFFHEEGGITFNKESFKLDKLLVLFSVLIFLSYGSNTLIAVLIVEAVAWNCRPLSSHYLMLSKSIKFPAVFIKLAVTGELLSSNISVWLITILALYVIYLIIKDFYKEYTRPTECLIDENIQTE